MSVQMPRPTSAFTYPGQDGKQYVAREWWLYLNAITQGINDVSGLQVITGSGAPVDGVTGANEALPNGQSVYIDISGSDWYMNAGTVISNPMWKLIGRSA